MNIFIKILISAVLIGGISEIARRNSNAAALLASLPLVALLSMIWIYHDTHDVARIAGFSRGVFWYVLPSLILFLLLPPLLTRWSVPFYPALAIASGVTIAGFFILRAVLRPFGVIL
jgi:hypothetical protein